MSKNIYLKYNILIDFDAHNVNVFELILLDKINQIVIAEKIFFFIGFSFFFLLRFKTT
jgi:hypothetical protein